MNWLNVAAQWLRKLPIAKLIKPFWKAGLQFAVKECGDWLQVQAQAEIAKDLAKAGGAIIPLIEQWKDKVDALVLAYAPAAFQAQAVSACDSAAAQLEGDLGNAVAGGSAGAVKDAVDKAFDNFQAQLIARIAAL